MVRVVGEVDEVVSNFEIYFLLQKVVYLFHAPHIFLYRDGERVSIGKRKDHFPIPVHKKEASWPGTLNHVQKRNRGEVLQLPTSASTDLLCTWLVKFIHTL